MRDETADQQADDPSDKTISMHSDHDQEETKHEELLCLEKRKANITDQSQRGPTLEPKSLRSTSQTVTPPAPQKEKAAISKKEEPGQEIDNRLSPESDDQKNSTKSGLDAWDPNGLPLMKKELTSEFQCDQSFRNSPQKNQDPYE